MSTAPVTRLEFSFPYTAQSLPDLMARVRDCGGEKIQLEWHWQPYHAPFFEAARYAAEQNWHWTFFEAQFSTLSCPAPPARLKKFFAKKNLLDDHGRVAALDLEPVFRTSFAAVQKNLDLFENRKARLLSIEELQSAFDGSGDRWIPLCSSSQDLSTFSSKTLGPLKTFHDLAPWQKLAVLELVVGVAKSSSFLHFQRIDGTP